MDTNSISKLNCKTHDVIEICAHKVVFPKMASRSLIKSVEELNQFILNYELDSNTRYVCEASTKNFGNCCKYFEYKIIMIDKKDSSFSNACMFVVSILQVLLGCFNDFCCRV